MHDKNSIFQFSPYLMNIIRYWLLSLQKQHHTLVSISLMKTYIKKNIGFWLYKSNTIHWFPYLSEQNIGFWLNKNNEYNGFRISRKHHNENHSSSFTISNHSHNKRNLTCTNFKTNYSKLTRTNKKNSKRVGIKSPTCSSS